MDSTGSHSVPGNGCGTFAIVMGSSNEIHRRPTKLNCQENWLRNPSSWEVAKESSRSLSALVVMSGWKANQYGDLKPVYENTFDVLAVPCDTPQIIYRNDVVNNLRLHDRNSARPQYFTTPEQRRKFKRDREVSIQMAPTMSWKLLRLKQRYFMCSAGIQKHCSLL